MQRLTKDKNKKDKKFNDNMSEMKNHRRRNYVEVFWNGKREK